MINIIAAVDEKGGIGKAGKLLLKNKEDIKFFREKTLGKYVVMGRKTYESIPNGILPGRMNIILTTKPSMSFICRDIPAKSGIFVVNTKEQIHEIIEGKDTFIIGGGTIYDMFIRECDRAFLTYNQGDYHADTFFPDIHLLGKNHGYHDIQIEKIQLLNETSAVYEFTAIKKKRKANV